MDNKELVILAAKGGGGGSVTPESIVSATSQMTTQQVANTRNNLSVPASEDGTFSGPFLVSDIDDSEGVNVNGGYNESNEAVITLSGSDSVEDVRVSGIATPVNNNDAANKAYVDANASGGVEYFEISFNIANNTADKTFQELLNAYNSGKLCYCKTTRSVIGSPLILGSTTTFNISGISGSLTTGVVVTDIIFKYNSNSDTTTVTIRKGTVPLTT